MSEAPGSPETFPSEVPLASQAAPVWSLPASRSPAPGGPVHVELYDTVEPIATEWDRLADRLHAAPFLRPGWIDSWWRAFGSGGGGLQIATLWRDNHLSATLPLHQRRGCLWSASNWHTPGFGMLADDEAAARTLIAALLGRRPVELSLAFLDAACTELALWRELASAAGYRVLERVLEQSPYLLVDGTWEAYRRGLSRNRRAQLGRCRRRLEREGRLELELADGTDRLDELLEELFRIEALGWKGGARTAIASHPETRRFYAEIAGWAARRGWLRFALLRLDRRTLAVQYLLEEGDTLYALKGGFDPAFARFSPGMVLLEAILRHAFDAGPGIRRVHLGGGDEWFKLTFTRQCETLVRFQAFARSPAGLAHWAAFAYGRPAAKRALAAVPPLRRRPVRAGGHG